MLRPAVTQLISKNDSYYSLVIGIAKRAREIAEELESKGMTLEEKPVKTAVEEFAVGKFRILEAAELEEYEKAHGEIKEDTEGAAPIEEPKDVMFSDIDFDTDDDDDFDDFDDDDGDLSPAGEEDEQ